MAQVNDIVRDALGHLRVIDAGAPVKPIDMRDATRALNLIGRRWAKNGLLETWTDVAEPTDTVPVPDTAEEPLAWNLAIRMRSNYGVEVPEEVGLLAIQGVVDLWRDRIAPDSLARTVGSIVLRALRMLVRGGSPPDTFDLEGALIAYNAMLARWQENGLAPDWTAASSIADALETPATADEAIAANLAIRLAPEYRSELPPAVVSLAESGLVSLWRDRITPANGARTAGAIILRALRMLVTGGTFPDQFNLSGALTALNAMLQRWEANGMALGWSAAASVDDELPTPPEADEAIAANLAVRLQPEYGAKLSPAVLGLADGGLAALRRDRMVEMPLVLDCAFHSGRYNAYTDSYEP